MKKNNLLQIIVYLLFLCLTQSQKLYQLDCEITQQFNEQQVSFNLKDCVDLIELNKKFLTQINVFHKQQELPNKDDAIHVENVKELAESLHGCDDLDTLQIKFDNPQFQITFEDLTYFTDSFKQLKNLSTLELNFNNQNLQPTQENNNLLEQYFNSKNFENLRDINLQFYGSPLLFTDYNLLFKNFKNLSKLEFNFGGQKDTKNLVQLKSNTFQNMQDLNTLSIGFSNSNEKYFENIFDVFITYISSKFEQPPCPLNNLVIDLSNNKIGNIYSKKIKPVLQDFDTIHYNFDNCQFDETYLDNFENIFSYYQQIDTIKIDINYVKQEAVLKAIGNALQKIQNLSEIYNFDLNNKGNISNETFTYLYKPIQQMGLDTLSLNFYEENTQFCPSFDKFEDMISNKGIYFLYLEINLQECARNKENYKNYEKYYKGIKSLDLYKIKTNIIAESQFIDIFNNQKNLDNINLKVYNYVKPSSTDQKLLLFSQSNIENLSLQWYFLAEDKNYPIISKNDNYYKSMEDLITEQQKKKFVNFNFELIFLDQFNEKTFDISFIQKLMLNLKNLTSLQLKVKNVHPLNLDLDFLGSSLDKILFLENLILDISNLEQSDLENNNNNNLEIKDINFISKIFQKNEKMKNVIVKILQKNVLDFKPLESTFRSQLMLENLTLSLNNGYFNENLQTTFLNNKKLKQLLLFLGENKSENYQIFNSILQPLYNTVTSFCLSDDNNILNYENQVINLKYMKEKKERVFINDKQKVEYKKCENFDSICQDCTQEIGNCSSCLYNFVGKNCDKCKAKSYFDEKIDQCLSCSINDENCLECQEDYCLECIEGYEVDEKTKQCVQIQEERGDDDDDDDNDDDNNNAGDNTGLIVGLSVGGSIIVLLIVGISVYVIKKKKLESQSQSQENVELLTNN